MAIKKLRGRKVDTISLRKFLDCVSALLGGFNFAFLLHSKGRFLINYRTGVCHVDYPGFLLFLDFFINRHLFLLRQINKISYRLSGEKGDVL